MLITRTNNKPFEIEVKRFYFPYIITSCCSKCGDEFEFDGNSDYISYPVVGQPEKIYFYCDDCSHEWSEEIVLDINVKKAE